MVIGLNEEPKTLDEAINFNPDNIFDYLQFILHNRNADDRGDAAHVCINKLYEKIKMLSGLTEDSYDTYMEVEDLVEESLNEVSAYAYAAGFREACRLCHTLNSF